MSSGHHDRDQLIDTQEPKGSTYSRNKRTVWGVAITAIIVIIIIAVLVGRRSGSGDSPLPSDPLERAKALQARHPLIDGHNDLPWEYRATVNDSVWTFDLNEPQPQYNTDLPRLKAGVVGGQFWSVYVPCSMQYKDATRVTMEQIDVVYKLIERYPSQLMLALTADDIESAHSQRKLASLMGIEGGHSIDSSLGSLRQFHRLGVRYMTLTHTCHTPWADSCEGAPLWFGLNDFGRDVVREMNRVGMFVDLAHVSNLTMHAALDVTTAPVIFSHSCTFALCPNPRNVPDDVLVRLPANGGVVMINFYNAFVSCNITHSTIAQVVDHMDHIKAVAGVDHIGIGSDFDGVSNRLPDGLTDVATYPNLVAELIRRKYTDEEVIKIIGGNLLRAMRGMEAQSAKLRASTRPLESVIFPPSQCRTGAPHANDD